MEQPITLQEFEDLPLLRSTFFHFGLGLDGNAASVLDCNEHGEARVAVLGPPQVAFHFELSFFKSGNTVVSVPQEGKVKQFYSIRQINIIGKIQLQAEGTYMGNSASSRK